MDFSGERSYSAASKERAESRRISLKSCCISLQTQAPGGLSPREAFWGLAFKQRERVFELWVARAGVRRGIASLGLQTLHPRWGKPLRII